jgi:predicted membrane-bound spermidine synthase
MDIYVDGTAGSPMYRFNGNLRDPDPTVLHLKDSFPGFLPLLDLIDEEKDSALVIGSGGGRDVLLTLMAGFRRITAVEINKDLVEIVQTHSTYNGGIYSPSGNVKIVVDEGRHFLKHQRERYDLIFLSLPVTNSSRSLEGYSLTENFLFTRQSMEDYLTHLTEEGQVVVVTHNDAEVLRLLSIALVTLSKKGIGQEAAMRHIHLLGSDDYPVFVLKKRPFKPEESLKRYEALRKQKFQLESSYSFSSGLCFFHPLVI